MATTVEELLKVPFSERTYEEKVKIVTAGKPRPVLNFWTSASLKNKLRLQEFPEIGPAIYEKVKWLTGCKKIQKFLCWPCLLYVHTKPWNIGISNLAFLSQTIKAHETSAEHIDAVFKMQIFIMNNVSKSNLILDEMQCNETTNRNREILKLFIDAICFVTKNQSCDNKYECNLLKVKDCVKFLQLLRACNRLKIDLIDVALLNKFQHTLNALVDSITFVVKEKIVNEIRDCEYVSLVLNEHVTNSKKSQISTVLRYIKNDKVCERFLGFTNIIGCRWDRNILESHILNIIKDYGISENLLSFSVDGALLARSELSSLLESLKSRFELCYFIPGTGFGYALLESLYVFEECRMFLKTVNAIESFFKNVKRLERFEEFLFTSAPKLRAKKWYTTSPFITFLSIYRKRFIDFFDQVVEYPEAWPADDVVKAEAFRSYLQQLHTVFLLTTLNNVFSDHFDENYDFKTEKPVEIFSGENIRKFRNGVIKFRNSKEGFSSVWTDLSLDFVEARGSPSSELHNDPIKSVYATLFMKIICHLIEETDVRCKDLKRLAFCDMLNCNHLGMPNFKNMLRLQMQVEHGSRFVENELNSEIIVFKGHAPLFSNKTVHGILEVFAEYNFRNVFVQISRLIDFILTLPILRASREQKASKVSRIRDYSYIPKVAEIPSGDISVICVETEMVQDLKSSETFYDDVLAKFFEMKNKNSEM